MENRDLAWNDYNHSLLALEMECATQISFSLAGEE